MYETIHTGTPIVSLEGDFLRSRFVAGAYRLMGLENPPVAATFKEYVEIVVRLIENPEELRCLRTLISERAKEHLYDRMDFVRGLEEFLLKELSRVQTTPTG